MKLRRLLRNVTPLGAASLAIAASLLVVGSAALVLRHQERQVLASFEVESSWRDGQKLEAGDTCASGTSPELTFKNLPEGTKSIALFLHAEGDEKPLWLVSDISSVTKVLQKGSRPEGTTYRNAKGNFGYIAPCAGKEDSRYTLSIFALKLESLEKNSGVSSDDVLPLIRRSSLAEKQLTVTAPAR